MGYGALCSGSAYVQIFAGRFGRISAILLEIKVYVNIICDV